MPRYRKLHTKVVESLDVNDMPDDFTRLLWVLMPLGLDREGRGLDNPAWVKAKLMPLRLDVTAEMIEMAMAWYTQRGMIERYQVERRSYFWLPTFHRYQGATIKESASEYPAPPEQVGSRSGVGQEPVESRSRTDADSDANADADSDANADTDGGWLGVLARAGVIINGRTQADMWEDLAETANAANPTLFREAVETAAANNALKLSYVRGIVDRCIAEGRMPGESRASGPSARAAPEPAGMAGLREYKRQQGMDDGN